MLPHGTIPHHFFCPITQDVMNDPVKTVDGMTYDRPAIDRWLQSSDRSPLTGLPLASKALTPHAVLREQIAAFVAKHAHLVSPQPSSNNLIGGTSGGAPPVPTAAAEALGAVSLDAP